MGEEHVEEGNMWANDMAAEGEGNVGGVGRPAGMGMADPLGLGILYGDEEEMEIEQQVSFSIGCCSCNISQHGGIILQTPTLH